MDRTAGDNFWLACALNWDGEGSCLQSPAGELGSGHAGQIGELSFSGINLLWNSPGSDESQNIGRRSRFENLDQDVPLIGDGYVGPCLCAFVFLREMQGFIHLAAARVVLRHRPAVSQKCLLYHLPRGTTVGQVLPMSRDGPMFSGQELAVIMGNQQLVPGLIVGRNIKLHQARHETSLIRKGRGNSGKAESPGK